MNTMAASDEVSMVRAEQLVTAAVRTGGRPASRKRAVTGSVALGALVVVALTGAWTASTLGRMRQEEKLYDTAAEVATARPRVTVVQARSRSSEAERVLPGSARPLLEAGLYPRATGYIQKRLVDIGDRVQKGQLLAVIDAPDLDDQLAHARANLAQARANWEKAKANAAYSRTEEERYRRLLPSRAVSREEYESKFKTYGVDIATVRAMEAAIKVNEAAVQRFADLQGFERIVAPFPGVITARHIDPGDHVTADGKDRELFHLMRTDVLRVFVDVPQVFATGIQVGQRAVVYRREDPLRPFSGTVTRTADALDPNTRTLRTEVQVANPENALRPGMYLQVKFVFSHAQRAILIPSAAVVTRSGPPRVAVLDTQQQVQYRSVKLGRDYGAEVEVLAGLTEGDPVVVHPGDDLPAGTVVDPVRQQPAAR